MGILPVGKYRLSFAYHKSSFADFEVIKVVRESGVAKLSLSQYEPDPKSGVQKGCLGIIVAGLRTEDTTVIASAHPTIVCRAPETGRDLLSSIASFSRLAEFDGVNGLAVSKQEEENILVSWTDDRGKRQQRIIPLRKPED